LGSQKLTMGGIPPIVSVWEPKMHYKLWLPWICSFKGLRMTQKSRNVWP